MLREVYARFVKDYDIEVKNYLEVLAEMRTGGHRTGKRGSCGSHYCIYARYENIRDQPRELLRAAGLSVREQKQFGKSTHCCGGPLEML